MANIRKSGLGAGLGGQKSYRHIAALVPLCYRVLEWVSGDLCKQIIASIFRRECKNTGGIDLITSFSSKKGYLLC